MTDLSPDRLAFWNERSGLGLVAGSGDINLKALEIKAIHAAIGRAETVLDAGCGNAYTLVELSTLHPESKFFGFDYSAGMISAAKELIDERGVSEQIRVCQGNLVNLPLEELSALGVPDKGLDCVYTERSLINLDTLEQQVSSIQALWNLVASGGSLVLCESFLDGLREINEFRQSVDLSAIQPPWHNRYFSVSEVVNVLPDALGGGQITEFSGTYYFVSRVVNARAAFLEGIEPSYDAKINIQSLDISPLPVCGQSKIVVFRKS